jgi:Tol biopolymer transport system component
MMRLSKLYLLLLACSPSLGGCNSNATSEPPLSDPRGLILLGTVAFPAELWAMRPDGSELRRLTNDSINDLDGNWSPDGRSIVFTRWQDSVGGPSDYRSDVFVMNADGSGMRRLYFAEGWASGPRWSPDGRRIAFAEGNRMLDYYVDTTTHVYIMNADGSGVHVVAPHGESFAPDWAPDGTQLLFLARRPPERPALSIYTIRPDGTDERLVGGDVACVRDVHDASWSPDGTRIVYRCSDAPDYIIKVIHADGTSPVQLSFVDMEYQYGMFDLSPVWSPDGTQIAFGSTRTTGLTAPWVMDTTGANSSPKGGQPMQGLVPVDWGAVLH